MLATAGPILNGEQQTRSRTGIYTTRTDLRWSRHHPSAYIADPLWVCTYRNNVSKGDGLILKSMRYSLTRMRMQRDAPKSSTISYSNQAQP